MIGKTRYKVDRERRDKRDVRRLLFYATMFLLLVVALSLKRCLGPAYRHGVYISVNKDKSDTAFNWLTAIPYYTAHAKCRMECRHITEKEVTDILRDGSINISKSSLDVPDCEKKYALDGYSKDNQHLRIVAAHCGNKLTIITCIDLNHEWPCVCGTDY